MVNIIIWFPKIPIKQWKALISKYIFYKPQMIFEIYFALTAILEHIDVAQIFEYYNCGCTFGWFSKSAPGNCKNNLRCFVIQKCTFIRKSFRWTEHFQLHLMRSIRRTYSQWWSTMCIHGKQYDEQRKPSHTANVNIVHATILTNDGYLSNAVSDLQPPLSHKSENKRFDANQTKHQFSSSSSNGGRELAYFV